MCIAAVHQSLLTTGRRLERLKRTRKLKCKHTVDLLKTLEISKRRQVDSGDTMHLSRNKRTALWSLANIHQLLRLTCSRKVAYMSWKRSDEPMRPS